MHAVRLRDVLRATAGDPRALAFAFDEATEAAIAPWYHAQIAADRLRFAQIAAWREGRQPPSPTDALSKLIATLLATMTTDPNLFRAALEYVATVTPIQEIMRRPQVAERVRVANEALRGSAPPVIPGPTREELPALMT
jgi:DNA-binding PucR family transcriptional regulator